MELVLGYSIIHSIKIAGIIFILSYFLFMLIMFSLEKKKYLAMWSLGLGFYLISYVVLLNISCEHSSVFFIQKITSTVANVITIQGCMYLLKKKIQPGIFIFLFLNIIILILSALKILPNEYGAFTYFTFLLIVNV